VADVADALMPLLSDRPFALFGHSLGAIVAFELSRTLRRESAPAPVHLFVSGRIAPQLADARPRLHSMPDDDLVRELSGLGGTPAALLDSAGVRSAVLPVLRADLALNEMYRHVAEEPLDVPLTVFGGHSDPKTSVTELASWQAQTTRRPFGLHMMAGGHFFVAEHRTSLFGIMANVLEPWLAPVCASSQLGLQGDVSR
jgi:surfactin synthase thioesterase subunit